MADEKKPGDKPIAAAPATDPFVEIVWIIAGLLIGLYVVNRIFLFFNSVFSKEASTNVFVNKIKSIWLFILGLGPYAGSLFIIIGIICVVWIVYFVQRLTEIRHEEQKLLYPEVPEITSRLNPAWDRIMTHIESLNENDWRLSILEADIMLGDILEKLALPGDTIGEKLKAVDKSNFTTIDSAWEAHKIRNQVAHEGMSFSLNQHEARRVIELYRAVFEEFHAI